MRRRENFHAVFLCDGHYLRNVLLLLGREGADVLEETFEARWGDDAHETAGRFAGVTIAVRYATRCEDGGAGFCEECFAVDGEFVIACEHLEGFIFAMMDVGRWATARDVVRFDDT